MGRVHLGGARHLGLEGHHGLALAVAHLAQHMGLHDLTRGHPAVSRRDLQRRDEHVALADDHVGIVAATPGGLGRSVAEGLLFPGGRGQLTARLAAKIDPGALAETELLQVLLQSRLGQLAGAGRPAIVEALGDLIEDHVAGVHDAAVQVQGAVAVVVPALLHVARAETVPLAGASPAAALVGQAVFQTGQRGEGLERGGSRILARDRAVVQGLVGLVLLLVVVDVHDLRGDGPGEVRRVEGRIAGHDEHRAVPHVQGHHGPRAADALADHARGRDEFGQGGVGHVLGLGVDGEVDIGPLGVLHVAHHRDAAAGGVHHHLALTVLAGEHGIVGGLHTGLAHGVDGQDLAPLD